MKKILKPSENEEAVYYSDLNGKFLDQIPPVEINIDFNYGSKYDGSKLQLHYTDEEFDKLFDFLETKLTPDIENKYEQLK